MIVTTTSTIQGKEIIDYVDIVNGEAIMGANIVRDLFASVRDVVGGRSGAYESKLKEARDIAMEEMKTLARQKCECHRWYRRGLRSSSRRDANGCCERDCCSYLSKSRADARLLYAMSKIQYFLGNAAGPVDI